MQGKHLSTAIILASLMPTAAIAGDVSRRPACIKTDTQRQAQPQKPPKARTQECRATKPLPPLFDPTPTFLL